MILCPQIRHCISKLQLCTQLNITIDKLWFHIQLFKVALYTWSFLKWWIASLTIERYMIFISAFACVNFSEVCTYYYICNKNIKGANILREDTR